MMVSRPSQGREKQRFRTRTALVQAAKELFEVDVVPTVVAVAEAADISRATAYRYFPTQADLLRSVMEIDVQTVLESIDEAGDDLGRRLDALLEADYEMRRRNETQLRAWVRVSIEQRAGSGRPRTDPIPRGGRITAIERALRPAELSRERSRQLGVALSLLVGTESFLVLKDLWGLEGEEAKDIIRWAAHALLNEALKGTHAKH